MAGQQTKGSRNAGRADTSDTRARASDDDELRRRRRQRDAPLEAAYNAGYAGDDPAEFQTSDELFAHYRDGARAARADRRHERLDQAKGAAGAKAGSLANDGAGFLLGLFAYALLANYLRAGVPGVRAWLSAKFLNEVSDDAARPDRPAAPSRPAGPIRGKVGATAGAS